VLPLATIPRKLFMSRKLIITGGPEKGRTFPLEDGQTLVIGRGQASDTKINDPHMSRIHCRVQVDGGRTVLLDAGGAGTLVRGDKIEQHELQPGDEFQVGGTTLRFQLGDATDQATMAPAAGKAAVARPQSASLKDLVGQTLAHYRLDKIITAGNTGMVYLAHDTEKNRPAAVKVLAPDYTDDDEQRERFVRAMKTMLPMRHTNIVRLYHAGKTGPYCWAAMEYIDGESLTKVIDRIGIEGMLDWREVWRVAVHIGRALEFAFEQRIIHRNVTPTNILRRHADKVCLLGDLMLAKALEGTLAKQVTRPGQLVGDVPYMSPERTRDSGLADCRSDIYGLGATLYALLTGRPPFERDSLPELVRMVRENNPVPPKRYQLAVNDLFQDLILKMLAKRPEDRFQNPTVLLSELARIGNYHNLEADFTDWK
jgi:serine/threonine protein kinase